MFVNNFASFYPIKMNFVSKCVLACSETYKSSCMHVSVIGADLNALIPETGFKSKLWIFDMVEYYS